MIDAEHWYKFSVVLSNMNLVCRIWKTCSMYMYEKLYDTWAIIATQIASEAPRIWAH